MSIAILGEALIDFKNTGPLAFQGFIGGSSLNVATAAARLGQPTAFLAQISTDIFGHALFEHIEREGIDSSYVLRTDASSTLAFVEERDSADGVRQAHFSFVGKGAADTLYDPQPRPILPDSTRFLQFGSISLLNDPTSSSIVDIVSAHRDRLTVVFDPNCRPQLTPDVDGYRKKLTGWLKLAHLVKVSDQDLGWLEPGAAFEDVARGWLEYGPHAVIVTRGEKGSALYRKDRAAVEIPTPQVSVVDTVGAGDTYTAGLMVGLLERGHTDSAQLGAHPDDALREVMQFAAASAAINCTRAGANPPTRGEVSSFQES